MPALKDSTLAGGLCYREHVREKWPASVDRVQLAATEPLPPSGCEYQSMNGFGLATVVGPR